MTFGRAAPIDGTLFHNGARDLMLAAVIRHLLMEDSIGCRPIALLQGPREVGLNDHWVIIVRNRPRALRFDRQPDRSIFRAWRSSCSIREKMVPKYCENNQSPFRRDCRENRCYRTEGSVRLR